jgi:hypothetical protein
MPQDIDQDKRLCDASSDRLGEPLGEDLYEAIMRLTQLNEIAPQDGGFLGLTNDFNAFLDPESECFLDHNLY